MPNPTPAGEEIEALIQAALKSCSEKGVTGNKVTPYILSFIHEKSGGKSLDSNIALIKSNARVAASIAVEHMKLKAGHSVVE